MFVIPCKYRNDSFIFDCVRSIRQFHPNEDVVVVDSSSDDISYLEMLRSDFGVVALDSHNRNYEFGALRTAYNFNPNDERYVLVHDSTILKDSIDPFLNLNACALMYFPESVPLGCREHRFISGVLEKTQYNFDDLSYLGVFGSMAVYSREIMKTFELKGLFREFSPIDKFESQMSERIVGICLKQEGINLADQSIEGNFLSRVHEVETNGLKYFRKKFLRRG